MTMLTFEFFLLNFSFLRCNIMSPFGVQMGHRHTCIFSRNRQAAKYFQRISNQTQCPKTFFMRNGAFTSQLTNTTHPHQPYQMKNISNRIYPGSSTYPQQHPPSAPRNINSSLQGAWEDIRYKLYPAGSSKWRPCGINEQPLTFAMQLN